MYSKLLFADQAVTWKLLSNFLEIKGLCTVQFFESLCVILKNRLHDHR
jgi:hypothetical protein